MKFQVGLGIGVLAETSTTRIRITIRRPFAAMTNHLRRTL